MTLLPTTKAKPSQSVRSESLPATSAPSTVSSTPAATLRLATAPSTKYSATSVKSVVVRRTVRNMGMLTSLMP